MFFTSECHFTFGWSHGASEALLGETSTSRECSILVKEHKPSAIGAIWQSMNTRIGGHGNCYATFNIPTSVDKNPKYQSCIFEGRLNINS